MQTFLIIMLVITIGLALHYFHLLNERKAEILELERELGLKETQYKNIKVDLEVKIKSYENEVKDLKEKADNAQEIAREKVSEELYVEVFQKQNYSSLENLKNKIKTILDPTNKLSNIE